MRLTLTIVLALLTLTVSTTVAKDTLSQANLEELAAYQKLADSINNSFQYETGAITLKGGLATINVPTGFKYLNGEDSERILTDIWGNPPSTGSERSLGMLFLTDAGPLSDSSYAINITYTEEGHIDDSDASKIDYDELLASMKEGAADMNKERIKLGYQPVEIVGWASPPYYDAENKKLHWAKEAKFGDEEDNTLNYNIRVLGRKGYLQMNVIGQMSVLDQIKKQINPVITSVNFNEGNTYSDFDPSMDEVAAYGIGALIAGKVLAKAGLFAKLGIMLAKFWKLIALAVVGLFAGIRRFFKKG